MSFVVEPIAEFYRAVLNPMQPFSALAGLPITLLDIAACFRLCLVLRQVREQLRARHDERVQSGVETRQAEDRSFTREAFTTLLIVFGGEAITGEFIARSLLLRSLTASIMFSTVAWTNSLFHAHRRHSFIVCRHASLGRVHADRAGALVEE